MELYQEVVSCTDCGARITLAGLREAGKGRVTRHAVDCPICLSRVPLPSSPPVSPATSTRGAPPRPRR